MRAGNDVEAAAGRAILLHVDGNLNRAMPGRCEEILAVVHGRIRIAVPIRIPRFEHDVARHEHEIATEKVDQRVDKRAVEENPAQLGEAVKDGRSIAAEFGIVVEIERSIALFFIEHLCLVAYSYGFCPRINTLEMEKSVALKRGQLVWAQHHLLSMTRRTAGSEVIGSA